MMSSSTNDRSYQVSSPTPQRTRVDSLKHPLDYRKYGYTHTGRRNSEFEELDYHMDRSTRKGVGGEVGNNGKIGGSLTDSGFLKKVQHELEGQRMEWKDEVDKITEAMTRTNVAAANETGDDIDGEARVHPSLQRQQSGNNTFVDLSTGSPIFKAFVGVREYPPQSVSVNVNKLENKIIVKACRPGSRGNPDRTFTQKVQLPKFADERHITSGLNVEGMLVLQVPLIYYFPPEKTSTKAFINEVKIYIYYILKDDKQRITNYCVVEYFKLLHTSLYM